MGRVAVPKSGQSAVEARSELRSEEPERMGKKIAGAGGAPAII